MELEQSKNPVRLTREELYEQVWKMPLLRLAKQYGISGTGLSKICKRAEVPCPPAGHWTRVAMGKQVKQPPLPKATDGIPASVLISPTPRRHAAPEASVDVQEKIDASRAKNAALKVPESLRKPHTVIARWIADHARRVAESKRDRSGWGVRIDPLTDLDHRRHRILSTIFTEAEKIGFSILLGQHNEVWLETGKNRIDFSLQERIRQVRRTIKPEDRPSWNPNQQWTQEKLPTGELVFKFRTPIGAGIQESWTDLPDNPLEQQVGEIMAVLHVAGPLLEQKRLDVQERERVQREQQYQRQQEADHRRVETNRWRRFLEFSDKWVEAERASRFITAIEALGKTEADAHGGHTHNEWLAWAKARLATYDPLQEGSERLWSNLANVKSWDYRD